MSYFRLVLGFVICLLTGFLLLPSVAQAATDVDAQMAADEQPQSSVDEFNVIAETAPNCRYGVSAFDRKFLTQLRVGWIQNFGREAPANLPGDIEYTAMVNVRQDIQRDENGHTVERYSTYRIFPPLDELEDLLAAYPGRMWIVGNEPDRAIHQDDTQAHVYAMAYHEVYHFIKGRDPSAQVATAGLVGVTPGRRQYLDLVWESYRSRFGGAMPVDVWTFHDYTMAEVFPDGRWSYAGKALGTDLELAMLDAEGHASRCSRENVHCMAEHDSIDAFEEQVVAMRRWMKEHGQQDKPLVLTEFGLLYPYQVVNGNCTTQDENGQCFTPQRSADFMVKAYEYLENAKDPDLGYALDDNRLVQQWMWFSMPWPAPEAEWNPSLLANVGLSELTIVGQTHIAEINKRPLELNLLFKPGNAGSVQAARVGQPVTLSIQVYNNGNTTVNGPVQVTFYADAGRTRPIGTATIPPGIRGCARRAYRASVVWNEALAPGTYPYWVTVDPNNSIPESNNLDNYADGILVVSVEQLYLPRMAN